MRENPKKLFTIIVSVTGALALFCAPIITQAVVMSKPIPKFRVGTAVRQPKTQKKVTGNTNEKSTKGSGVSKDNPSQVPVSEGR